MTTLEAVELARLAAQTRLGVYNADMASKNRLLETVSILIYRLRGVPKSEWSPDLQYVWLRYRFLRERGPRPLTGGFWSNEAVHEPHPPEYMDTREECSNA